MMYRRHFFGLLAGIVARPAPTPKPQPVMVGQFYCVCKRMMQVEFGKGWPHTVRVVCQPCGIDKEIDVTPSAAK